MDSEFENKRYVPSTLIRSTYDIRQGKNYEYPPVYSVYDTQENCDISIKGFKPSCYEDVRDKAIELNNK